MFHPLNACRSWLKYLPHTAAQAMTLPWPEKREVCVHQSLNQCRPTPGPLIGGLEPGGVEETRESASTHNPHAFRVYVEKNQIPRG